jgi:YVTN family beta-propeller protein
LAQQTVDTVDVGTNPSWATYDPANGFVYVPDYATNTTSLIDGTTLVAEVRVGSNPISAVYDSATETVYVANSGSANLTVLNGTTVEGTVVVGYDPGMLAFDTTDSDVYVPNCDSNTTSVVRGLSVVATLSVGYCPWNATWDPSDNEVYVTNYYGGTVSVLSGTNVARTVAVGDIPQTATYDSWNGCVYVTNVASDTVSVLNGTTNEATIPVGGYPYEAAFDPRDGDIFVGNVASGNVSVISGSLGEVVATIAVGVAPEGVGYDGQNGWIYIANADSSNESVINGTTLLGWLGGGELGQNVIWDSQNGGVYIPNWSDDNVTVILSGFTVTFVESGLPAGTGWSVDLSTGPSNASTSASLSFGLGEGSYAYGTASDDPTYAAPGGTVNVTDEPVELTIAFQRVAYGLTFAETGLPLGTIWTISIDGGPLQRTNSVAFSTNEPNGTYSYRLGLVPGWTTASFSGSISVHGKPASRIFAWTEVTYTLEFQESGLAAGTGWWVNLTNGATLSTDGGSVSFDEPNGTYAYLLAASDRTYAAEGGTVSVDGQPLTQPVTFSRVLFGLSFAESGLPTGTNWSVALSGGAPQYSTASVIGFLEPNGTYSYNFGPQAGWATSRYSGGLIVAGHPVVTPVSWTRVTYTVTFTESGLPTGAGWAVTFGGVSQAGTGDLSFPATPNGSVQYVVRTVAGFTASPDGGTVKVSGGPVIEPITFHSLPSPSSTFLGASPAEGVALLGGMVAAIVVGAIVAVRSTRRGMTPAPRTGSPFRDDRRGPPKPR